MAEFHNMRSQFEGLAEIRAAQQRKLEDEKEIKRYERALSTNQGRIKTVRRMILNHPDWLNKCLVICVSSSMINFIIQLNPYFYVKWQAITLVLRTQSKIQFHNGQWNALHVATSEEQLQKVLWLMQQKGIDINAPDKVRQAQRNYYICACMIVCLSRTFGHGPRLQHNFRPIELAMARNSDTSIVKALLRAGANIDNVNIRSVRPEFKKLVEASYRVHGLIDM